jgi:hypothetical protein
VETKFERKMESQTFPAPPLAGHELEETGASGLNEPRTDIALPRRSTGGCYKKKLMAGLESG